MRNNRVLLFLILAISFFSLAFSGGVGFRSQRLRDASFEKHGREFGNITVRQYVQLAQQLRDARLNANIMESRRPDGIVARFDRKKGYFGSYDPDRSIRTFFIPANGVRYFERQARRWSSPE